MPTEAATAKESSVQKRAQWEAFEFRVPVRGRVRVENTSHGDVSKNHVYVVTIEDGEATECTCPDRRRRACKHRVAVENQPAVMAASEMPQER